ncbi:hypothetical protein ACWC2T_40530 [Streptomyces sp. NPDC001393]
MHIPAPVSPKRSSRVPPGTTGRVALLTSEGFTAARRRPPMALLEPRRLIADEGLANAVATDGKARSISAGTCMGALREWVASQSLLARDSVVDGGVGAGGCVRWVRHGDHPSPCRVSCFCRFGSR